MFLHLHITCIVSTLQIFHTCMKNHSLVNIFKLSAISVASSKHELWNYLLHCKLLTCDNKCKFKDKLKEK